MFRGVYIDRADAERMTFAIALKRYSEEVTGTKSSTTTKPERHKTRRLLEHLGDYSLAAVDVSGASKTWRLRTSNIFAIGYSIESRQ